MFNYAKRIVFLLILFLLSCNSNKTLTNSDIISGIFSSEEAVDLQRIHDFFAREICKKTGIDENNTIACFENFQEEMKATGKTGTYTYLIDFERIKELFTDLKTGVFNQIWTKENSIDEHGFPHEIISINLPSDYTLFLKKVGEKDEAIAAYHEDLLKAGGISATTTASMLMLPEKYNVDDPHVRLIIAIHYLTIYYQT